MLGYRAGAALILMGLIGLFVFWTTLTIQQGNWWVLLGGTAAASLGFYLRRRNAPPFEKPSRFRFIKRLLGRGKGEQGKS